MAGNYQGDSIFWVEVDRIKPNPFQPRRTFDETALASLAESIRQYGVLQPLAVTRKEIERPGEGIFVEYELIAGERRLRASKLAGIASVPVVIRTAEDSDRMKLELAIIENLQREDLNAIDRAEAFNRLANEFGLKHAEIGKRVGKSREYVSNTLRILMLPQEMRDALAAGSISDGHTRPLLMLIDRPEQQATLFKEIISRRITVRDAEGLARRIALDRARNKASVSPDLMSLEKQLSERLGTRVRIEKKDTGGKLLIDFFSPEDLTALCLALTSQSSTPSVPVGTNEVEQQSEPTLAGPTVPPEPEDDDLYSISNFSL
ncbi:MAG TPA: ParB/RepB/Spo0J family partition protein [Candidatus Paceibacterota bacterium]|nr:ParB/RepB/Spo0J family partition protein [Candidatus Paceibacterota bacterium]